MTFVRLVARPAVSLYPLSVMRHLVLLKCEGEKGEAAQRVDAALSAPLHASKVDALKGKAHRRREAWHGDTELTARNGT